MGVLHHPAVMYVRMQIYVCKLQCMLQLVCQYANICMQLPFRKLRAYVYKQRRRHSARLAVPRSLKGVLSGTTAKKMWAAHP